MNEIKKNWKLVFYSALASAVTSVLCLLCALVGYTYGDMGIDLGFTIAFLAFGLIAAFLLVLYAVPYVIRFFAECFEYYAMRH